MAEDRAREPFEARVGSGDTITIADEVVAVVAGIAATEVQGVAGMAGGFVGDLTERLGLKSLQRGVKVEVGPKETALDVYITVAYGSKIHEVAKAVQESVQKGVSEMTGLRVTEVRVHVRGVAFDQVRRGADSGGLM